MKAAFLLSKEDLELSRQEVLALTKGKHEMFSNLLIITLKEANIEELSKRLAYTKSIYRLLFKTDKKGLKKKIRSYDWNKVYEKDICIRSHGLDLKESQLANIIWKRLKSPKTNLKNPTTKIEFFMQDDKILALLLVNKIKEPFEKRRSHLRPEYHPTALHPRLARAMVNLTGAKKSICDPFCGTGGILLEAGLMGIKPIGYDLYREMLKKAKKNLEHYNIKGYELKKKDAVKIEKRCDYVATDPPYGLNTSIWTEYKGRTKKISLNRKNRKRAIVDLEEFYIRFLKNLKKILSKRAVIIFPHYVDYERIVQESGFKLKHQFSQYIHSSLTRNILVIQ